MEVTVCMYQTYDFATRLIEAALQDADAVVRVAAGAADVGSEQDTTGTTSDVTNARSAAPRAGSEVRTATFLWRAVSPVIEKAVAWEERRSSSDAVRVLHPFVVDMTAFGAIAGVHITRLLHVGETCMHFNEAIDVLVAVDYYCMSVVECSVLDGVERAVGIMGLHRVVQIIDLFAHLQSDAVDSLRHVWTALTQRVWQWIRLLLDPDRTSGERYVELVGVLSSIDPRLLQGAGEPRSAVIASVFCDVSRAKRLHVVYRTCDLAERGICSFHPSDVAVIASHELTAYCTTDLFQSSPDTGCEGRLLKFLKRYLRALCTTGVCVQPATFTRLCDSLLTATTIINRHGGCTRLEEDATVDLFFSHQHVVLQQLLVIDDLFDYRLLPVLSLAFRFDSVVVRDLYPLFAESMSRDAASARLLVHLNYMGTSRLFEVHVLNSHPTVDQSFVASFFENRAHRGMTVSQRAMGVVASRIHVDSLRVASNRSTFLSCDEWDRYLYLMDTLRRRASGCCVGGELE